MSSAVAMRVSSESNGSSTEPSRPLRVLVVDDHSLIRRGVCDLLSTDERLGEITQAANAEEALEEAGRSQPDVIVLDVVMPGTSGIDAVAPLLGVAPAARVLLLSMYDDLDYLRAGFAAGASGYVLKDAADVELIGAIHDVAAGSGYVDPNLGARLLQQERQSLPEEPALTAREQEVFALLALAHTNREIAGTLGISVRTAETHRVRIFRKLQVHSRAELLRYALERGLLGSRGSAGSIDLGGADSTV